MPQVPPEGARSRPLRPALLLLAALLAVPALAEEPRYRQVELAAEASREVANDLLVATLFTEVNDDNPARAADAVNRSSAEALKQAARVESVKAASLGSRAFPVYGKGNRLEGWRARAEIRIESRDFAAASALLGRLQATMQLEGLRFTVAADTRRKVEDELIGEALGAFRQRADLAGKALGGKGWKLVRVALGSGQSAPPPIALRARAAFSSEVAPPAQEGGASTISVSAAGVVELE